MLLSLETYFHLLREELQRILHERSIGTLVISTRTFRAAMMCMQSNITIHCTHNTHSTYRYSAQNALVGTSCIVHADNR